MASNDSIHTGSAAHVRPVSPDQESAAGLLTRLLGDVTALLRNELTLARTELKEAVVGTKRGVAGIAAGAAILYAGFLFLLAAATFALAEVMEWWLAALIVGGLVSLIGYGLLKSAQRKLDPSAYRMDRTRESLRQDAHAFRRAT